MANTILLIPGIGNSGPDHWQSRWQAAHANYRRVEQRDWDHPVCSEWMAALEHAVASSGAGSILVAHSLGCLLVAHWLQATRLRVAGALLVAIPDPGERAVPGLVQATGVPASRPCPRGRGQKSIVVASQDDPYASSGYARGRASSWGSRLVDIGKAGHINAASGLGNGGGGSHLLARLTS